MKKRHTARTTHRRVDADELLALLKQKLRERDEVADLVDYILHAGIPRDTLTAVCLSAHAALDVLEVLEETRP